MYTSSQKDFNKNLKEYRKLETFIGKQNTIIGLEITSFSTNFAQIEVKK